jgi:hypothetical protein
MDTNDSTSSTIPSAGDVFVGLVTNHLILCKALVLCDSLDDELLPGVSIRDAAAQLRNVALNFGLQAEEVIGGHCPDCNPDGDAEHDSTLYSYGSAVAHPVVTACYRIGASANAIASFAGDADEGDLEELNGFAPAAIIGVLSDPDVVGFFDVQRLSQENEDRVRQLVENGALS